jgi:hypothetical protein
MPIKTTDEKVLGTRGTSFREGLSNAEENQQRRGAGSRGVVGSG